MPHINVDGVDYTREGIENVRAELIKMRDESMKQWPDAIPISLLLSHTLALLARLAELTPEK